MKTPPTFDSLVIKLILDFNTYDIKEVSDLNFAVSLFYSEENYQKIKEFIIANRLDELKTLQTKNTDEFREYVEIFTFKDQSTALYAVTIYDSDALWQDPELLDIFGIEK
jgi:hypothetical protein